MQELFRRFSVQVSKAIGSFWAVLFVVILFVSTGWCFHFSTEWVNETSLIASISALLTLIFLQKSQNHSDKATHLKLDELIRAIEGARNEVTSAEQQPEKNIDELRLEIEKIQPN